MKALDSIRIVLVGTTHPGNIGSAARAMKAMGLSKLYLVTPKHFPDQQANDLASGATDILEQAVVTATLTEALQGCHQVFATSARFRKIALENMTPAQCAAQVASFPASTEVAIVFGREHAGLTNEELLHCHYHIHIPSNPVYNSLNLAQAVQIISYELRCHWLEKLQSCQKHQEKSDRLATLEEIEGFYTHLHQVLVAIDFLKPSNPKRLFQRLRRLFNRSKLEALEVNILRGILSQIQQLNGFNGQ